MSTLSNFLGLDKLKSDPKAYAAALYLYAVVGLTVVFFLIHAYFGLYRVFLYLSIFQILNVWSLIMVLKGKSTETAIKLQSFGFIINPIFVTLTQGDLLNSGLVILWGILSVCQIAFFVGWEAFTKWVSAYFIAFLTLLAFQAAEIPTMQWFNPIFGSEDIQQFILGTKDQILLCSCTIFGMALLFTIMIGSTRRQLIWE
ncbi:hypothetical protein [Persicobacter diffluens]|uniref:Uncharacterized protein n=1 Tax=Persicobacter diffluens TaxID=981 RepID=A0AAN5AM61_9BACT|nr:hypothetical protein PEDI_21100 [Persicobacter diffluens]